MFSLGCLLVLLVAAAGADADKAGGSDCFSRPSAPECAAFAYPPAEVRAALDGLCAVRAAGDGLAATCDLHAACALAMGGRGDAAAGEGLPAPCDEASAFERLAVGCAANAAAPECTRFLRLCSPGSQVPGCMSAWRSARTAARISANAAPAHVIAAPRRNLLEDDMCLNMPGMASCTTYTYPEADASDDLMTACMAEPSLVACTLREVCNKPTFAGDTALCAPFVLLATLCADAPDTAGCATYSGLCAAGSVVAQCSDQGPIPDMLGTAATISTVRNGCLGHFMDDCERCTSTSCPDPLSTYSSLCTDMPGMGYCDALWALCDTSSFSRTFYSLCGVAAPADPVTDDSLASNTAYTHACLTDPSAAACDDYEYPEAQAQADLTKLCNMMPWMIGCTLRDHCADNALRLGSARAMNALEQGATEVACDAWRLVVSVCVGDPGMSGMGGCANYNKLCASGSIVPMCSETGTPQIIGTMQTQDDILAVCSDHEMSACSQCPARGSTCTDPLGTISELCTAMPGMAACAGFLEMCADAVTPDAFPALCGGDAVGDVGDAEEDYTHTCLTDPSQTACINYVYPPTEAQADLVNLCSRMPWMIGCTLMNHCADDELRLGSMRDMSDDERAAANLECDPWRLLVTICVGDPGMSGMGGCANYNSLCATNSNVAKCSESGVARVIGTMQTQESILAACGDHYMSACDQCPTRGSACADPMRTISELCIGMPDMPECAGFFGMCDSGDMDHAFPRLCDTDDYNTHLPPMRMYFHQGVSDIILFREWVPRSNGEYVGAIFAILAMGLFTQALRSVRSHLEARWFKALHKQLRAQKDAPQLSVAETLFGAFPHGSPQMMRNLIRGSFTAVLSCLDLALMLVAMTFNVGLFIATFASLGLGTLLFGHVLEPVSYAEGESESIKTELESIKLAESTAANGGSCCAT